MCNGAPPTAPWLGAAGKCIVNAGSLPDGTNLGGGCFGSCVSPLNALTDEGMARLARDIGSVSNATVS